MKPNRYALVVLFCAAAAAAHATTTYTVTDLGVHQAPGDQPPGDPKIGRNNHVVMTVHPGSRSHEPAAVLYRNGVRKKIATLGSNSWGIAINRQGDIVGDSIPPGGTATRAFLWSKGVAKDLGALEGEWSAAYAVNNKGQVVGQTETATGSGQPFLYSDGVMTRLPGEEWTIPYGINDRGQITGSTPHGKQWSQAFRYEAGTMKILKHSGCCGSHGAAINSLGDIAGQVSTPEGGTTHAALFRENTAFDLGTLGGPDSSARDINDSGHIVGGSQLNPGDQWFDPTVAFVYRDGQMHNLQDQLDPATGAGWVLREATGINNEGRIVGWGLYNGRPHRFLLTPMAP